MRRWIGGSLAAVAGVAVIVGAGIGLSGPAHADAATARTNLAISLKLLKDGNYSASRAYAQKATAADPSWGLAHTVLARAFLALGDGIAAEGELNRAAANGFDMNRAHQLVAEAWLLQGDTKRALAEAARTAPRFAGYGIRVTARAMAAQGDSAGAQQLLGELLDAEPRNALAWGDLGRIRYNSGDVAGAAANAQQAIAIDPADLAALTLRGELVREQYGLAAALPWFEATLRHDAYYHPALIEYAATLGDMGRYNDMLAVTRKALAARPGSPQALYLQAVMAARAENYDLARTLMQRAGNVLDDLPGALLLDGILDYQAAAYEQAIEKWRELVGHQPMNITARRLLGAALLRSGDTKGALDVLRPVALRGDADSYTLALVGRAFEAQGERDWAARFLDRAAWPGKAGSTPFGTDDSLAVLGAVADQDPGSQVLAVGEIRAMVEVGQTTQALTRATALAADNPGAPAAHLLVGDLLTTMKRYGPAAESYRRAADIRFDEGTMLRTVDALDLAGRRPEAANVLAMFLTQHPENVAALWIAAHWQIAAGEWDSAIDTLENLRSRIGSRDAGLLAELSFAYLGSGDNDQAVAFGNAAYDLAPLNPAATDAYGWALYAAGDNAAAADLLEKAVTIAPDNPILHWHLAQVYADLGRKVEAATQIRTALADPAFGQRAPAQALMKMLG